MDLLTMDIDSWVHPLVDYIQDPKLERLMSTSPEHRSLVYREGPSSPRKIQRVLGCVGQSWPILEFRFSVEGPSLSESLEVAQAITLLWTPCRYGGRRPWFRCPGITRPCGRRVGVPPRPAAEAPTRDASPNLSSPM